MLPMVPPLLPPKKKQSTHHFTHKNLYFSKINISCNCKEKNLEIPAVELEINYFKLMVHSFNESQKDALLLRFI
jgi:hypothetical protein